jgi:hypothetical protein
MSIYYANTGSSNIRLNSDFVDPSVKTIYLSGQIPINEVNLLLRKMK